MNQQTLKATVTSLMVAASLGAAGCGAGNGEDVGDSTGAVSDPDRIAYDFFGGKGLARFQAAGIVGNLDQESSMSPTVEQYGGGPGRGIAQWSAGGRWNSDGDDNVVWYAHTKGESEYSLTLQLEFVWYELETFPGYGLSDLRHASDVTEATIAFQDDFEGCGECDQSQRIGYAEQALSAYGHRGGGGGAGAGGATGCYSDTLGRQMQDNACVQSKSDDAWYQCDSGSWVDRWTDPTACDGVYPL